MSTEFCKTRLLAIADELRTIAEELHSEQQTEFPADREPLYESGICLYCEEHTGKPVNRRGTHEACYHALRRSVEKGETTWDEAIRTGRIKPAERAKGRPKSAKHAANLARLGQAAIDAQARKEASDSKPPASPLPGKQ